MLGWTDGEFTAGHLGQGRADGCGGIVRQFGVLADDDHERGRVREPFPDAPAVLDGEQVLKLSMPTRTRRAAP